MTHICESCGTVGKPVTHTKGSFILEVVLWILFCAPGLIYTIWRLTTREQVCPTCKGKMIATNTPRGQLLMQQYQQLPRA
jgi:hypothetical protein